MPKSNDSVHVARFRAEAKRLHKDVRAGEGDALRTVAPYFADPSDFKLTQAQLVVARTHHHQSWKALVAKDDWVRCSFCTKWQYEVSKVIAGPDVHVCDECVELCHQIIEDERAVG